MGRTGRAALGCGERLQELRGPVGGQRRRRPAGAGRRRACPGAAPPTTAVSLPSVNWASRRAGHDVADRDTGVVLPARGEDGQERPAARGHGSAWERERGRTAPIVACSGPRRSGRCTRCARVRSRSAAGRRRATGQSAGRGTAAHRSGTSVGIERRGGGQERRHREDRASRPSSAASSPPATAGCASGMVSHRRELHRRLHPPDELRAGWRGQPVGADAGVPRRIQEQPDRTRLRAIADRAVPGSDQRQRQRPRSSTPSTHGQVPGARTARSPAAPRSRPGTPHPTRWPPPPARSATPGSPPRPGAARR